MLTWEGVSAVRDLPGWALLRPLCPTAPFHWGETAPSPLPFSITTPSRLAPGVDRGFVVLGCSVPVAEERAVSLRASVSLPTP